MRLVKYKMNIKLDENFRVTSDPNNFILNEIKISEKNKEEYVANQSFYGKLEDLFEAYFTKVIMNSKATDIGELLAEIRTTKRYIKTLLGAKSLWKIQ